MIDHRKTTAYRLHANGGSTSQGLNKNFRDRQDDWDDKVPVILWAYRTTYKRSTAQTPFKLVYGKEVVIPLHFWANAERVASVLRYDHTLNTKQHFYQFNKLEEERMLVLQHQEVQKYQQKAWYDQHLKKKDK